jgi:hypothetical protein
MRRQLAAVASAGILVLASTTGTASAQTGYGYGYTGPTLGQPQVCLPMDPSRCASPPTAPQSGATFPDWGSQYPGAPGAWSDSSSSSLAPLALPPLPFPERGPYLPTSVFSPFYWGAGPANVGFPGFPGFGFPDLGFPPAPVLPPILPPAPPSVSPPGQACPLIFPPPPGC